MLNTSFSSHAGKSSPTTANRVNAKSTPRSLRHWHNHSILDDAKHLAAFLQRAVEDMANSDSAIGQDDVIGFSLAFDLLRDKIAIANGELAFPLIDTNVSESTAPDLWTPATKVVDHD